MAGQPLAVPELIPPHHGLVLPLLAIFADRDIRAAHVVGTW